MTSSLQHREDLPPINNKQSGEKPLEKTKHLKIQFLFFPGCPNHKAAWRELTDVLADHELEATVERTIVQTDEDAKKLGFLGSPTLKVNGVDVEPSARKRTDFGISCRVYRVNGRLLGSPSRLLMEKALLEPKEIV